MNDRGLKSGVVSLGASETALHSLLLPVLGAFHRAYPGIRLRISNHSTPQALAALRAGLVDLAVITSPLEDANGLHIDILGQFEEIPVCGCSLRHLCGQALSLDELSDYPFICLGHETASYAFAHNLFTANGLTFCTGSLGASPDNDLPRLAKKYASRIPFAHLRNILRTGERQFEEVGHPSACGSLDMYAIVEALVDGGFDGYVRPDHGRMIWGETGRYGYGLYDRALGAAYLNGLFEAVERARR